MSRREDRIALQQQDDGDPGYQRTYGRETIIAGHVLARHEHGTNAECVTCRAVDSIQEGFRAMQADPQSIVDELDMTPEEAHEAVTEADT